MITGSGVQFEQSARDRWKAVLPQGQYLPENLVVERTDKGLQAHLEAPLDGRYDCYQSTDGRVQIDLKSPGGALAVFDPSSLEYGIQVGERLETYTASGDWSFQMRHAGHTLEAVVTQDGKAQAWSEKDGRRVPMALTMFPDAIRFSPRPTLQRLREDGWRAALSTQPTLQTFLFRENGWKNKLFPDLKTAPARLQGQVDLAQSVRQLANRPAVSGIQVGERSVSVGGVQLRRR